MLSFALFLHLLTLTQPCYTITSTYNFPKLWMNEHAIIWRTQYNGTNLILHGYHTYKISERVGNHTGKLFKDNKEFHGLETQIILRFKLKSLSSKYKTINKAITRHSIIVRAGGHTEPDRILLHKSQRLWVASLNYKYEHNTVPLLTTHCSWHVRYSIGLFTAANTTQKLTHTFLICPQRPFFFPFSSF